MANLCTGNTLPTADIDGKIGRLKCIHLKRVIDPKRVLFVNVHYFIKIDQQLQMKGERSHRPFQSPPGQQRKYRLGNESRIEADEVLSNVHPSLSMRAISVCHLTCNAHNAVVLLAE